MSPIYAVHYYIDCAFRLFGLSWWSAYFILKKLILLCLTLHMLLFRLQVRKPNPKVPNIQVNLYDVLFGHHI